MPNITKLKLQDDINSSIYELNTTIENWSSDVGQIDGLVNNWNNLKNRIYNFDNWYIRKYDNTDTARIIKLSMNNVGTSHHTLLVWGDSNNIGFFGILYGSQPVWIEGDGGQTTILSKSGDNATTQYSFRLSSWSSLYVTCCNGNIPENYYTVSYEPY